MSYCLFIEWTGGKRRARRGIFSRREERIPLGLEEGWWRLPVLEIAIILSRGETWSEFESDCHLAQEPSESLVLPSLALSLEPAASLEEDTFEFLLSPMPWPYGGMGGIGTDIQN